MGRGGGCGRKRKRKRKRKARTGKVFDKILSEYKTELHFHKSAMDHHKKQARS